MSSKAQSAGGAFEPNANYTVTGDWTFGTKAVPNKVDFTNATVSGLLAGTSNPVVNGSALTSTGAQVDTAVSEAVAHAVAGVASSYKVARGITALGGTNPTTIATGLASVTGLAVVLNRSTSLASGTAFVTYNNISGGSVDLYAWVVAGTASTGTENVAWVAIGT